MYTDASNGKQWPRGSRRREPATGLNNLTKSEPTSRKPTPQRNRTIVDKRPKPRGVYYGNNGGVATNVHYAASGLTEPDIVELGSVFVHGSKKENINSLCGFNFGTSREARSYGERAGHRVLGAHRQRYNKEHFLQAKYVYFSENFKVYFF